MLIVLELIGLLVVNVVVTACPELVEGAVAGALVSVGVVTVTGAVVGSAGDAGALINQNVIKTMIMTLIIMPIIDFVFIPDSITNYLIPGSKRLVFIYIV